MQNEITKIWNIFRFTFGLVPIVAGLDKFTNLLVNWEQYLSPAVQSILPVSSHFLLSVVGIIEITAGMIVLRYTKIGSLVVMAWLTSIALLLISGGFFDIAVRDIVMAISAYGLFRLTALKEEKV